VPDHLHDGTAAQARRILSGIQRIKQEFFVAGHRIPPTGGLTCQRCNGCFKPSTPHKCTKAKRRDNPQALPRRRETSGGRSLKYSLARCKILRRSRSSEHFASAPLNSLFQFCRQIKDLVCGEKSQARRSRRPAAQCSRPWRYSPVRQLLNGATAAASGQRTLDRRFRLR
jgi:hypothetical protein